ncbi:NAD(P)/FAD-dependent oxidoreductase [Azospirillum rugosum]|uniref:Glycine/D-amino acid oxidase-like deaminating enzyme n=1 Tax=Azospirillum rugosum TaxID=416170 RepID=A0ABS4SWP8_9PROT|nr:FAD-dependent oxidoreductase [Azospirillum rugosum]MBP2296984.1 glycine/D-amino acid oxidase-like deaminating enzyme [Azospirillum rugosum]MDQ0530616.1 glycine/D-amino acid oxidase-like deaminating enzyme [Azospirillum rugosum]
MTQTTRSDYDVAVIGGGLVGSAIAWGLAQHGQKVAILDEGDIAVRPSRGNFALVWVQGKGLGLPEYAGWTKRSADNWTGFSAQLREQTGIDVCYERPGGFLPLLSEAEMEHRANQLKRLHNQPNVVRYDYEMMDRAAVAKEMPFIGKDVVGASYCPLDGHCNSLKLLRALHTGISLSGVAYLPNHRVERIEQREGGFRMVTASGEVRSGKVVIAAGHDGRRLAPMVGLDAPVRPERGHIIVTEKTAPFLKFPVGFIRQTDEGGVMIGDSFEDVGLDTTVRNGVTSTIADRAIRIFPLLGKLNVVRTWAALRVLTPDGFPIYEQSTSMPGAFVATCHSGVTLAANHALALAPHIAAGGLPDEFTAFSARRFHVPAAA